MLFNRSIVPAITIVLISIGSAYATLPPGYTQGTPWSGPLGVRERVSRLMEEDAAAEKRDHPDHVHPRPRADFPNPQGNPISPDVAGYPPLPPGTVVSPLSPQTAGTSFVGATLADTRSYPPDSMGAAGPSQFIVAVNGRIRTFNKSTGAADGVMNVDTDVFFNSVLTPPATNNFTSDPRIRYDRLSGRWFIIMIDVPGQAGVLPNRVMIAVSDGPVITGGSVWTFYYFQQDLVSPAGDTGKFADYPTLGIDANALYVGVNIFGTRGSGSFANTTGFVVRKSSLLSPGGVPTNIVVTAFRGLIPNGSASGPYTPQGVDNYDPNATEGYFIGVASQSKFLVFGQLELRRISDPGGTPAISPNIDITVPLNSNPINVPHLGNTNGTAGYLDGLDYRLLAAHIRNGRLWTSENMGVDNNGTRNTAATRNGVRWYELQGIATGQTPSVVQSGTIFQSSPTNSTDQRSYWMGTVMVSGQGHAAMGFSTAGANERINAGTVGRLANDALGVTRTPVLYTSSSSSYNPLDRNGSPINRWGDYSYTSLDPSDDMTMWTIQEYCNANNSYAVQVVKLLAPGPATPSACSPSTLPAGTNNAVLIVTGTTNGDTGFFDPGNGFSNRISATVNGGGVTVNSITYVDPTHVSLNVSVSSGASAGTRTVTVANPDGQSATSASGLLTITGNSNPPPPTVNFVGAPVAGIAPLTVSFTNLTTGATNYLWSFGDSHLSTNVNPVNTYSNAGTYSVTLQATGAGGTASLTMTNYITVTSPAPVANFSGGPTSGIAPLSVTFTNSSTLATSYVWDFGDAQSSTAANPTHVYTNVGVFTVALQANGPGGTNTFTRTNYIVVAAPPPVAGFTGGPTSGFVPLSVTFSNSSTSATSYAWDFGDAQGSAAANPTHVYTNAGSFTVVLQAIGPGGTNTFTRSNYISAVAIPSPLLRVAGLTNDIITLEWNSVSGATYRVQFQSDLNIGIWSNLPPDVMATGTTASKSDTIGTEVQRFYRVQVML